MGEKKNQVTCIFFLQAAIAFLFQIKRTSTDPG